MERVREHGRRRKKFVKKNTEFNFGLTVFGVLMKYRNRVLQRTADV